MIDSSEKFRHVSCKPFEDQRPGTAGLRKKVHVFMQEHYLECFIQSILDSLRLENGASLLIGGDGRYHNAEAIQVIARIAAANGVGHLIIGQDGLLSTPAASHLIRKRSAQGGFVLTASHNPGGPDGDFGVKFNMSTGGQAPESLTEAVYQRSRQINAYKLAELPPIDLSRTGVTTFSDMRIEVVDPVEDYAALMQELFDFDGIAAMLAGGTRIVFDGLNGITGPYARRILCDQLGAPVECVQHATPLPDFGGMHPDPNPVDAHELYGIAMGPDAPDLAAASDGDGDRNMILGRGLMVSPGDSLAIMLANAAAVPGYRDGVPGVARSMPTSRAADVVAKELGIPCFETPTGWRYFCNLLEDGQIGLCGEESFGTGSSHVREKDGLWAVLFWLNLMAALKRPVVDIVTDHWARFGRHYYQRHDYFIADATHASALMESLQDNVGNVQEDPLSGATVVHGDNFDYTDPVDGSHSARQGVRLNFEDGSRIVYRLSGTGTAGATLRVYLERLVTDVGQQGRDTGEMLEKLGRSAASIARIEQFTGITAPTATI